MGGFAEKIGQLAVFLICARTLLYFRANDSYEKYVKLLINMILLVLLSEPLDAVFHSNMKEQLWDRMKVYEEKLQEWMEDNRMESDEMEETLQHITNRQVLSGTEKEKEEADGDEDAENVKIPGGESEKIVVEKITLGGSDGGTAENP